MTSNAKVNQVEMAGRCSHHIGWLEITEDDGWLTSMEVFKHCTKLYTYFENFFECQTPILCSLQVLLQRFTFDVVYHEIPMLSISKVVVYARQVGKCQDR